MSTVFLQLFFKTGSPVSFSVKIPYNIVDNKGGGSTCTVTGTLIADDGRFCSWRSFSW